jgi:hypothetical protein
MSEVRTETTIERSRTSSPWTQPPKEADKLVQIVDLLEGSLPQEVTLLERMLPNFKRASSSR